MKTVKLGTRKGYPAYFSMLGHFHPNVADGLSGVFRIGDKAAACAYLTNWRRNNPENKLVVKTDPLAHETTWSQQIPNEWMFAGVADELWVADFGYEVMPTPPGAPLHTDYVFSLWRQLKEKEPLPFSIKLPQWDVDFTNKILEQLQVPADFATVHPLMDARYDTHRNGRKTWWYDLIREMSKAIHVVVIGDTDAMCNFPVLPPGTTAFWKASSTIMQSLCVAAKSKCHIGGNTGVTHWAGLFGTPVVAAYRHWEKLWDKDVKRGMDTRPITVGAPLQHLPLHSDPVKGISKVISTVLCRSC